MAKLTVIPGGSPAAQRFEVVIRRHYDALYRAAYRFTRSVQDAEDLVQEVCARAYPRLEQLMALENPRAWLFCVLQRLFIDQTRRYDRSHVASLETGMLGEALVDDVPGPAEETEAELTRRRLGRAWERLDHEQRTLLALHDLEGYSLAELTQMTGLKEGTLKSRLHRARVKLGRLLHHVDEPAGATGIGARG